MLIAFYPRNSFGKKEGIDCAEELSHLDPTRNNSLFLSIELCTQSVNKSGYGARNFITMS